MKFIFTENKSTNYKKLDEGTWCAPDNEKKANQLKKLLFKPLSKQNALEKLYSIFGDDDLFDSIEDADTEDVRWIVVGKIEDYLEYYSDDIEPTARDILKSIVNDKSFVESYGGAYDLGDWQYFTRDDIVEFSDAVIEELSKMFNRDFEITDMNMAEDKNIHELYLEIEDEKTGEIYDITKRIDMRKIRVPRDLNKAYLGYFVSILSDEIQDREKYYTEEFTKDDFKYFDKKQLDKMIDGADEYKGPDKKSAVKAMKAARKDLDEDKLSPDDKIRHLKTFLKVDRINQKYTDSDIDALIDDEEDKAEFLDSIEHERKIRNEIKKLRNSRASRNAAYGLDKKYPYYISFYRGYPIYEPAEGGYYYSGNSLTSLYGYDSYEEALDDFQNKVDEFTDYCKDSFEYYEGISRENKTRVSWYGKYVDDNATLVIENNKQVGKEEKGKVPYM